MLSQNGPSCATVKRYSRHTDSFLTSTYMGIILWIVFGALAGLIASMIMNTDTQQSGLANIGVGIVGALLGGWLMSMIGETGVTGFNLYSLLVAILGAVVLLAIVRALRGGTVQHR